MKQRTSFILKGLISLVLSLVMLCGTAVTSLSAVTVDLAETGFNQITESNFGTPLYVFAQTPAMSAGWVTSPTSTSRVEMTAYDAGNNKKFYAAPVEFAQTINPSTISSAMLSFNLSFNNTNGNGGNFQYKGSSDSITVSSEEFEKLSDFKYQYSQTQRQGMFTGNVQVVWKNGENPQGSRMYLVYIPAFSAYNTSGHDYLFLTDTLSKLAITVNVKQMLEQADGSFVETTEAANIPTKTYSNLSIGDTISLSQTPSSEEYEFLGWYIKNSQISVSSPYTYTVADADKDSVDDQDEDFFTKRNSITVEARYRKKAAEPVMGKYIFKYQDRNGQERTVSYERELLPDEITGYSGNGGQGGVPTYIWNTASQALFTNNPLLTAALVVQGNKLETGEFWKDVDVYKNTIAWAIDNTGAENIAFDSTNHTVTVTATVTKNVFNVLLYQGDTLLGTVNNVAYGEVVTFLEQYNGQTGYHYVDKSVLPAGVKYWSSDKDGEFPLTTNPTFGMVIRGNEGNPDETTVKVYAQTDTSKLSNIASWAPKFEEADLTYSNDDDTDKQKYFADYLANYFSKDGVVVQDELNANLNSIKYGVIVVKSDSGYSVDKTNLITALGIMRTKGYESAALNSSKTIVAYRSEYNDVEHISNFNRTWYTFTFAADEGKMEGKKLTAMAYIQVGSDMYYSELNTDLVTAKTQTSEP